MGPPLTRQLTPHLTPMLAAGPISALECLNASGPGTAKRNRKDASPHYSCSVRVLVKLKKGEKKQGIKLTVWHVFNTASFGGVLVGGSWFTFLFYARVTSWRPSDASWWRLGGCQRHLGRILVAAWTLADAFWRPSEASLRPLGGIPELLEAAWRPQEVENREIS